MDWMLRPSVPAVLAVSAAVASSSPLDAEPQEQTPERSSLSHPTIHPLSQLSCWGTLRPSSRAVPSSQALS
eukprot:scaffold11247_cov28-Tisochrysis_lutea.AAC.2